MIYFPGKELLRSAAIAVARRRLQCVFVLSTGRVGTDSLARLLNLSPDIRAHHEPGPKLLAETELAYQHGSAGKSVPRKMLGGRLFSIAEKCRMRECVFRRIIYVETSNRLTYIAPELANYFPNSKFIHLHRNPADVIRSAMRRGYYDGHGWDEFRIEPREDDPFASHWQEWTPFEKCCWYWRAVNEFSIDSTDKLASSRSLDLPSDTLFGGDITRLQAVFEWIGVTPPSADAIMDILKTKHNSQDQNEFPKWEDWTNEQRDRLAAIVGPVAKSLGYEEYDISRLDLA